MQDIADAAPSGHLAFSDDGVITYANHEAVSLLGYTRDGIINKRVDSILTIATQIFYQTHFFPMLRLHHRVSEIFISLKCFDGSELPVLVNCVRKSDRNGFLNHLSFMVVRQRKKFEDELVQARKTAEEALLKNDLLMRTKADLERSNEALDKHIRQLEQRNKEQLQYSSIISHDLNEPLRKIMIFLDVLRLESNGELKDKGKRALEKVSEAADRMRKLLDVMNDFLLIDDVIDEPQMVKLLECLRKADQRVRKENAGVQWTLDVSSLPDVFGHQNQLTLLFFHLLENAVRYRKEDEPLRVKVDADVIQENRFYALDDKYHYVDYARIKVSDNGKGFNNSFTDKVFMLFKKLDSDPGTLGSGLAICQKIVHNHLGRISAESEEGKGTSITILLPVAGQ